MVHVTHELRAFAPWQPAVDPLRRNQGGTAELTFVPIYWGVFLCPKSQLSGNLAADRSLLKYYFQEAVCCTLSDAGVKAREEDNIERKIYHAEQIKADSR